LNIETQSSTQSNGLAAAWRVTADPASSTVAVNVTKSRSVFKAVSFLSAKLIFIEIGVLITIRWIDYVSPPFVKTIF
jgi:hypothetical protein